MKKYVLGAFIGFLLLMSGCRDRQDGVHTEDTDLQKEKLTIMHVDAESPGFRKFIENAEKELNLEIETIACPADADVRQAKISTILEAGDSSIDIFSVNDEMISEFKYKDYLKPLNDTVMTKELLSSYPESYMQNVPMKDGKVYSVPYLMDIMVFWVNREVTGDRENKNTREALSFLHDLTANGEVPISQITDRYEQIEQKFLDGKYGSIFMYSGAINTFECAGAYRMEKIQVAPLPGFRKNATNIATWQYVLNKASEHEKAAIKFLKYAASREGNIAYAECMKRLPARLDVIREEKLDIPGFQVFQDYVNHVELKERPFSSNPMKDISKTGILFQQYVMDQISQDEFCEKMEEMQKNQR